MFGTNANAVLPFKRNFHSTGTPAASQRYAEGIQTLRSITDPDDADAISEAISAFKWAAERALRCRTANGQPLKTHLNNMLIRRCGTKQPNHERSISSFSKAIRKFFPL